jgi:hypothetical protein
MSAPGIGKVATEEPSMRDPETGTFDEFIEHLQIVMPAIKALEDKGLSSDYIARFLEFLASWLRSRENDPN